MQKVFLRISSAVLRKPVRTVFIATLTVIVLITGVLKIFMATGNETFIKTDTDAYRSNAALEEQFGGESVVVLFKGETAEFLTVENLQLLEDIEQNLSAHNNVYSVIGPAGMVSIVTEKQAEKIKGNVGEMRDGLQEMAARLSEIGSSVSDTTGSTAAPDFKEMTGMFAQSSGALEQIIAGQMKLAGGVTGLAQGYEELGMNLTTMALQIEQLAGGLATAIQHAALPEEKKQELLHKTLGLKHAAEGLAQAGSKAGEAGTRARQLGEVPQKTVSGLSSMKDGLAGQAGKLQDMQENLPDLSRLSSLGEGLEAMAGKLLTLAEGLDFLLVNSDIMHAGLPRTERTLQQILYDDGALRPVFSQLILDENHALMNVKLTGSSTDAQIEEIILQIDQYFRDHPLKNTEVTVTGKPVLDVALRSEMRSSMQRMVLSALVLMIVIVSVVFNVRWRLFPLAVNFAAVVATMGLMGHLGIPMTMVSMAAFPILIGLGIDYSIQFHSRYEEEFTAEEAQTA